jgi:hypothetical protein
VSCSLSDTAANGRDLVLATHTGVDVKVSADQRGRGLGVSMDVHMISGRRQKREAVKKLESAVALKSQPKLPLSNASNSEMQGGSKRLKTW